MMIVSSILSRYAFLQSIATSAIISNVAVPRQADLPSTTVAFVQGHLHTNVLNVPQSSALNGSDDLDAQMKISASLVRRATSDYLSGDPAMAGSLLRLAFHDAATREQWSDDPAAFIGGPNASIRYEVDWSENRGIARPLKVVQGIYEEIGNDMGFSFADCIALAGASAVEYAEGPRILIKLGRKDVSEADAKNRRNILKQSTDRSVVETTLPSAGLDSDGLRLYFGALGLSEKEFVALSGAHDLGRHVTLLDMPKSCLKNLTRECLENAPVLMPFISEDPDRFSNTYFKKLLRWNERKITLGEGKSSSLFMNMCVSRYTQAHSTMMINIV